MRFPKMWYVRPAKDQTSLCIRKVWSEPMLVFEYSMTVKLLIERQFKGGCTGSSECTLVKLPHCWKSHVTALLFKQKVHRSYVGPDAVDGLIKIHLFI